MCFILIEKDFCVFSFIIVFLMRFSCVDFIYFFSIVSFFSFHMENIVQLDVL